MLLNDTPLPRRRFLTTIAGLGAAGLIHRTFLAGSAEAAADPLLAAIHRYRDGLATYNASPREDDEYVEATYQGPMKELLYRTPPATTQEGAMEALRLAVEDMREYGDEEMALPLVSAALAYFETM